MIETRLLGFVINFLQGIEVKEALPLPGLALAVKIVRKGDIAYQLA